MEIGLNIYSIRNLIDTEEKFIETCHKLKEIGYDFLQFSGTPYSVEKIKRELKEVGLPIRLTHMPFDRLTDDLDNLIAEHKEFGCENLGLGCIPGSFHSSEEGAIEGAKKLNEIATKAKEQGMNFFYHNHHVEFIKLSNGQQMLYYFADQAPDLNFTLDTYWVLRGGMDLCEVIERLDGRIGCVHLKDFHIHLGKEQWCDVCECPCGDGNINFSRVIPMMKKAGAKYFIVEQDNAAYKEDTFEQVAKSLRYLKERF